MKALSAHRGVFDVVVVGAGLMGSAAAKYLAKEGLNTLLVGAREGDGTGIHASHHDEARITRFSGPDMIWSHLAAQSLEQYPEIEKKSGVVFHTACGHLRCDLPEHRPDSHLSSVRKIMKQLPVQWEELSGAEVRSRLPYLHFGPANDFIYEHGPAGLINPRRLVAAQLVLARQYGLISETDVVERICRVAGGYVIEGRKGRYHGHHVVVAAGSYTALMSLLPGEPHLTVRPETVHLVEVDKGKLAQFTGMPGIIWNFDHHPHLPYAYILPPVKYPDGRYYIKIGADHDKDVPASTVEEYDTYMSGAGSRRTAAELHDLLSQLMPDLKDSAGRSKPCLLTYTKHGNPYIDEVSPGWFVAAGGCGKSAKSSDRIGLLAALLVAGKSWPEPFRREDFAVS